MMGFLCLSLALGLTILLAFVSLVQLLYLESLRLIRHEVPALEFFRETLVGQVGLDAETGSLSFSLVKHFFLFLIGVFFLCALVRPGIASWQSTLEAILCCFFAMLVSTYLIPLFLFRRTSGQWLRLGRSHPYAWPLWAAAGCPRERL